jgi:hypothetical protein
MSRFKIQVSIGQTLLVPSQAPCSTDAVPFGKGFLADFMSRILSVRCALLLTAKG